MTQKRQLHPLRTVEAIEVSNEMGPEELGNPHLFWMARRYTMSLECGHQDARISCNFHHLEPEDLMPKRVRCKECPAESVPVRTKAAPKHDNLATALTGALLGIATEDEQGPILNWFQAHGAWIVNEEQRARVYGAVALAAFDMMAEGRTVKHSSDLRTSIELWSAEPSEENREQVRTIARRLYKAQHAPGNHWFSARALVCLGRVASMSKHSSSGLIEALTWDEKSREGFYADLLAARREFDRAAHLAVLSVTVEDDSRIREHMLTDSVRSRITARDKMAKIWNERYPQISAHHAPALFRLLSAYSHALESWRARTG